MVIRVENLTKVFKQRKGRVGILGAFRDLGKREYKIIKAVDNVSFSIREGEIVGYIGPNGAGKSTTMKMLGGILVPTSGIIEVNGLVPHKNRKENAKHIGVVFGQRTSLWWDIPLSESFSLQRQIYRIPEKTYQENMRIFSDILDLDKLLHAPVRQLSLGQRMRADIACALLHNPSIVYLDEPTIGLDVVVKESIRTFIREMNNLRSTTVLLATHDMSDVEKLCSRVIVINQGQIMYDGSLDKLRNTYGNEEIIVLQTISPEPVELSYLKTIGVSAIEQNNNNISIRYNRNNVNSTAILGWLMQNVKLVDFKVKEAQIEDMIRVLYKGFSNKNQISGN